MRTATDHPAPVGTSRRVDRGAPVIARAIDAYPLVPDSEIRTHSSSTHWDVKRKAWITFDPQTHTYRED